MTVPHATKRALSQHCLPQTEAPRRQAPPGDLGGLQAEAVRMAGLSLGLWLTKSPPALTSTQCNGGQPMQPLSPKHTPGTPSLYQYSTHTDQSCLFKRFRVIVGS